MKKLFSKELMRKVCSACLFFTGVLHFDGISVLFFGEPEYPVNPDAE